MTPPSRLRPRFLQDSFGLVEMGYTTSGVLDVPVR